MTIEQLNTKLAQLPTVITGWMDDIFHSLEGEIIDRNAAQMEELGQDALGRPILGHKSGEREYAWPEYAEEKSMMGKESRFINLNLSGDFHSQMKVEFSKTGIRLWSDDDKTDLMVKNYGRDIFGLNESNMDWLVDEMTDGLAEKFKGYFV